MEHQNQPKSLELERAESAYRAACQASDTAYWLILRSPDSHGDPEEDFFADVIIAGNRLFTVLEKENRPGSHPFLVQDGTKEEDWGNEDEDPDPPFEHPELTFNRFSAYVYLTVGFVAFLAVCAAIGW